MYLLILFLVSNSFAYNVRHNSNLHNWKPKKTNHFTPRKTYKPKKMTQKEKQFINSVGAIILLVVLGVALSNIDTGPRKPDASAVWHDNYGGSGRVDYYW